MKKISWKRAIRQLRSYLPGNIFWDRLYKKDWPEFFKNQLLTIGLPAKKDQKRAEKTASGDWWMTNLTETQNNSEIILYQTEDGQTHIQVRLENETVWLTQKLLSELFKTMSQNITLHLNNIYSEKELTKEAICKDFLQVQRKGTKGKL